MCLTPMWVTEEMDAFEMKCSKEPGAAPNPLLFIINLSLFLSHLCSCPLSSCMGFLRESGTLCLPLDCPSWIQFKKNIHVQILFFFHSELIKKKSTQLKAFAKNEIAFKKHIKYSQGPALYAHWACSLCSVGQPSHPSI